VTFKQPNRISYVQAYHLVQANVGKDDRCVNEVITAAIYWPWKDFRGRRINSSQLMIKILELIESNSPDREGDNGMDRRDTGTVEEAELTDSSWVGPADDASVRVFNGVSMIGTKHLTCLDTLRGNN
jgi:hypothetical protein